MDALLLSVCVSGWEYMSQSDLEAAVSLSSPATVESSLSLAGVSPEQQAVFFIKQTHFSIG